MYDGNKILAIIPARSGSKGLLNKNILNCKGKPLIGWTIESAESSKYIDEVIVTTDSEQIAEVSKKFGASVPFIRPTILSNDIANTDDVIEHAINSLKVENYNFSFLIYLQPTSPLRTTDQIDEAIELYFKQKKCDSDTLVSVYEVDKKYNWLMQKNSNGYVVFDRKVDLMVARRQELESMYMPNGAIYIANFRCFNGFYRDSVIPYVMTWESSIDIDTREDFDKACELLSRN